MKYSDIKKFKKPVFKFIGMWCLLLTFLLANLSEALAGTEKYIGFWRASGGGNQVLQFDSWAEFVEKWKELGKKNLRLQDLEAVKTGNDVRYTGAWTGGNGKHALYLFNSWTDFTAKWKQLLDENGMQLIDIEVVPFENKTVYIGVWGTGAGGTALFQYNNWEGFLAKWSEMSDKNRVLIDVEAFTTNGKTNYVGVWESGNGKQQALYQSNWKDFTAKWKELSDKGYRLKDIDLLPVKGGEIVIGVWGKGAGGQYLWVADSWDEFLAKNKELNDKNLDLIDFAMVGYGKPAQKPPTSKPINKEVLTFSKGQPMKKDPVTGIEFPADMPAIVYPNFEGCNSADRKTIEKAWAMAHHHAWRTNQLFQFLDQAGGDRKTLWSAGYAAANLEQRKQSWSPFAWFGEYSDDAYRYPYIRDAVKMNFQKRFQVKNTVRCRRNEDGLHPCYVKNPGTDTTPSANHIVSGTINFCNRFFDNQNEVSQTRTVLHEMFHWLAPKGLAILDTQTHSDKNKNGLCGTDTDKMYGMDDALHLATSKGCWGDEKLHRGMAARNNDNYAYFILRFGSAVFNKQLTVFPD